jgi:predicted metal-binding protein
MISDRSDVGVTIFICITCGMSEGKSRGRLLFDAVNAKLRADGNALVTVSPVECLAVCKRPSTIALSGRGKWTCIVGDLDYRQHVGDVISAAMSFSASENGIIPWRQRPQSFRQGVVARVPPLDSQSAEPKT